MGKIEEWETQNLNIGFAHHQINILW